MEGSLFDTYVRRARIYPVLLVIFPLSLAAYILFQGNSNKVSVLGSLVVSSGGIILIAQIGRDWGKKREPDLFRLWAGAPTTRMLRYRYAPNDVLHSRRLQKLRALSGIKMPTEDEERLDADAADRVYETVIAWLREKTRDKSRFPLVFEENCNYGFRRNLFGMKPLGIVFSSVGSLFFLLRIWNGYQTGQSLDGAILLGVAGLILMLFGWIFYIRPSWVKLSADAYAERLLAAVDIL